MLTVGNLLAGLDVRVLAGEAGLDMPVRWVHISELLDPTPWLSGGEVLLSTGMQLDSPERQREFVTRLADHQLAGLGFGIGFAHARVPDAIVQAAAERDFPVFEVPYELPFIALTEAAFTQLADEQYAMLRRALLAHERLERIVLSERGLPALASALSSMTAAAVIVFGSRGELLVRHDYRRELDEAELAEIAEQLRERQRRREARQFAPGALEGQRQALALPIAAEGPPDLADGSVPPEAWLVAIKEAGPLSELDRLTLRQAVTIVALELLRRRVAGDTERRLAGDVLAAVLSGELTGAELRRRLAPFGCAERVAAIVMRRAGDRRGSESAEEAGLRVAMRREGLEGLLASSGQLICALIDAPAGEDELFDCAERVAGELARELYAPVTLGVGRAVAAADARRTFHEARCALDAVSIGAGVPSVPPGKFSANTAGAQLRAAMGANSLPLHSAAGVNGSSGSGGPAVNGAPSPLSAGGARAIAGEVRAAGAGGARAIAGEVHAAGARGARPIAGEVHAARAGGRAANRAGAQGRIATYRDLGAFQLLLALQDDEALRLYCDSVLGPIEAGEGSYGDELVRSLEAFIEENGQWERAARRLYCHRHTLRYRIRRIEQLTGRDLSGARDRIEFWLAIRGRELV